MRVNYEQCLGNQPVRYYIFLLVPIKMQSTKHTNVAFLLSCELHLIYDTKKQITRGTIIIRIICSKFTCLRLHNVTFPIQYFNTNLVLVLIGLFSLHFILYK